MAERAAARTSQLSDFTPEAPGEVLVRLVREAVYARIRHRALLNVLARDNFGGRIYHDTFREFVRRDFRALYAKLILNVDDFKMLHDQGHEDDEQYNKGFFSGEPDTIDHDE